MIDRDCLVPLRHQCARALSSPCRCPHPAAIVASTREDSHALARVQAIVLGPACVAAAASDGRAQQPFYKGKRLTVLINFAAGGPADIEAHLREISWSRNIDGAPSLVVQNIDGAGGLIGAQYLARLRPRTAPCLAHWTGNRLDLCSDPDAGASIFVTTSSSLASPARQSLRAHRCAARHQGANRHREG